MHIFRSTRSSLIVIAFVFVLLIVGYSFLMGAIFTMNRAVQKLERDVFSQEEQETYFREIKTALVTTADERAEISTRFLKHDAVVTFIEQIEALGVHTGVSVDIASVDIEAVTGHDEIEWLLVSIDADGSWQDLMYFISLVERIPFALSIDSVRINSLEIGEGGSVAWRGALSVRVAKWKQ